MSFTFDATILFSACYLAGVVEFAVWCHLAPVALEADPSGK